MLDGAWGTALQALALPESDFAGVPGTFDMPRSSLASICSRNGSRACT